MNKREQIGNCFGLIGEFCNQYGYTEETKKLLDKFLGNYLQNRRTPTELEMQLKLETLHEICNGDNNLAKKCILKTIESGWAAFYKPSGDFGQSRRRVDNVPITNSPGSKSSRKIKLVDEQF